MQPLAGLRVAEWALGTPGAYCGKLLADLGADVIKIEEPEGDPTRRIGPFVDEQPGQERSAYFLFLNTNKRGIVLDLGKAHDRRQLDGLLRTSDIFVTDSSYQQLTCRQLEPETVRASHPNLVHTAITPFGLTGPYRDYRTTDLVSFHLSGLGHATPGNVADLEAERPLRVGGRQADMAAGLIAAIASLHGVFTRLQTGRGQIADVSRLEAIASYNLGNLGTYVFTGQVPVRHREGHSAGEIITVLPCSDGLVCLVTVQEYQWRAFVETVLGYPEWADWEVFKDRELRGQNGDILFHLLAELTEAFTKRELVQACLANRVPCQPVNTLAETTSSVQLAHREFFASVRHPVMGEVRLPRQPLVFCGERPPLCRPAALLGEHTHEVLADVAAPMREPMVAKSEGHGAALAGIRVVDFTWVFAGPLCTRNLGAMGAEVIKIESQTHPDPARRRPNQYSISKKSASLNLTTPRGRELAHELIAHSDVVVENLGPGVPERLGFTYAQLKRLNPRIILVSCSGFGRTGPESHYVAYGQTLHAYSGLTYLTGYPGGPPRGIASPLTDQIAGTVATLGTLAALYYRRRTGKGTFVDCSMLEATAAQLPEGLIGYLANGHDVGSLGNTDPCMAPHDVYRCRGQDKWIAIAVTNDAEWRGLRDALGQPELLADPRYETAAGRLKNRHVLDRAIEECLRQRDRDETMHLMQRCGVPAGGVYNAGDVCADPQLEARGFFIELDEPSVGKARFVRLPWLLSPDGGVRYTPVPAVGEHNAYVYRELLQISEDAYIELVNDNVVY